MGVGAYQLGTGVTITELVTVLGVPRDPTLAVFEVEAPDNTVVTYTDGVDAEVTNPAVGTYVLSLTPAQVDQPGLYHYNFVGTGAVEVTSEGSFFMLSGSVTPPVPPKPMLGPCEAWCDSADVMPYAGYPGSVDLTKYAVEATMLLYELSGRQFTGTCTRTVRPCGVNPCGWWNTVEIGGSIFWLGGWWGSVYPGDGPWSSSLGMGGVSACGCTPLSRVRLSGYPVWSITEVLIDGAVVAPTTYRLDEWKYLTRVRALSTDAIPFWPSCQNLDLPSTQPGTFEVTYLCGVDPPPLGKDAAAQLAAQLYFAGPGNGDCSLPVGATKITRQGVTIDRSLFASWAYTPGKGWATGLALVDAFLAGSNPIGLRRRGAIFSSDVQPFARKLGSVPGGS